MLVQGLDRKLAAGLRVVCVKSLTEAYEEPEASSVRP